MKKEYIRIKLNCSTENQSKGFYLLITNGETYSDKEFEFVIEKSLLTVLSKNDIKFKQLPLQCA